MGIRHYQQGDMDKIQVLFKKVFHHELPEGRWKWKYINHPDPANPWVLIYEENGEILGHIALWVSSAYVNGQEKKIALRVDTMVDPDARGKGIYKQLNQEMTDAAKASGITCLYGFPAPKAKELLLRYTDGIHIADISRCVAVLKPGTIASALLPFPSPLKRLGDSVQNFRNKEYARALPGNCQIRQVDVCDDRFDELAEALKTLKPAMLKRDAAYLNWRFHHHPENDYKMLGLFKQEQLLGYIVVKRSETAMKRDTVKTGFIVDWLAMDDSEWWDYLLQSAVEELCDTAIIQTWIFPENQGMKALKKAGFKEKDKPMPFVIHDLDGEKNIATDSTAWWLTQADVDSF